MKEISHLLRKAFLDVLTPFTIEGVTIPIFDNIVNPEASIPLFRGIPTYMVILDQNENDIDGNDCSYLQNATITFDIVTKFQGNVISSLPSELVSNQLLQTVLSLTSEQIQISDSNVNVLTTRKLLSRVLVDQGASLTAIRKRIIFESIVYES